MKLVFLILCFVSVAVGQQPNETKRMCNERAEKISKTLESYNPLRISIEQGRKGDCIHQIWMDKMQELGVKQAAFLIEYSWKNKKVKFKVKSVSYFRLYFSGAETSEIKDRKILQEIKAGGLEQKLKDVVIAEAEASGYATYEKGRVKRDVFTAHLLDDEVLPDIWFIH